MNFIIRNGLPVVSFEFIYQCNRVYLENVLLDTGCAVSIFDVDVLESTGIRIDPINGITKRMYGVGGQSELCYEQELNNLQIGSTIFSRFTLHLGMTQDPYGFDGILGSDYFLKTKSIIDYSSFDIYTR